MKLEVNAQFEEQQTALTPNVIMSPIVGEDYYLFRVHLYKDQYLLAFPKFNTIGIGFAQEEDWNTNLPFICVAEDIYDHIKHNKKYKEIKKQEVMHAIELLQVASAVYLLCGGKKE